MTDPRHNLEIKARLRSLDDARRVAESLPARRLPVQRQVDTYFHCSRGRLKLREINDDQTQLVWYDRGDQSETKLSQYVLVPVSDPQLLKAALESAHGVRQVVTKRREIYLVDNVRIHLDEVDELGEFIEFEAVLGPADDEQSSSARLKQLRVAFDLRTVDLIANSYGDMK